MIKNSYSIFDKTSIMNIEKIADMKNQWHLVDKIWTGLLLDSVYTAFLEPDAD